MVPNLASRPFMNTRPVKMVAGAALCLTLFFGVLDLKMLMDYRAATRELRRERSELASQGQQFREKAQRHAAALKRVRWRSLARQVNAINRILSEHAFSWLQLFADLGECQPRGVRITRLAPSVGEGGTVELAVTAVAHSRDQVLEFLQNLVNSPKFRNPIPRSEETPEAGARSGYTFRLKVTYVPGGAGK